MFGAALSETFCTNGVWGCGVVVPIILELTALGFKSQTTPHILSRTPTIKRFIFFNTFCSDRLAKIYCLRCHLTESPCLIYSSRPASVAAEVYSAIGQLVVRGHLDWVNVLRGPEVDESNAKKLKMKWLTLKSEWLREGAICTPYCQMCSVVTGGNVGGSSYTYCLPKLLLLGTVIYACIHDVIIM